MNNYEDECLLKMKDMNSLCTTCLSTDRRIVPAYKMSVLLQEIDFLEVKDLTGGVCWECWRYIINFYRYKKRAQLAQETLIESIEHNKLKSLSTLTKTVKHCYDYTFTFNFDPLTNFTKPKTEAVTIKQEFKYQDDIVDNTTNDDENIESVYVDAIETIHNDNVIEDTQKSNINDKEIKHNLVEIALHADIDEKNNQISENIYTDSIETKPNKKILRKSVKRFKKDAKGRKGKETDEIEFQEKFVEVVLAEEEMVRVREEKRKHHNYKKIPYKCDSCVLGFTRKENLNTHIKKKHDKSIGSYICNVCNTRFPSKLLLTKHRKKHYVCYRCKLCKYEAHELWSAVNHCKVKHSGDGPDRIHCMQCEVVVKTPADLEDHIQTEHTLYCNECGVKFKGMNTLRRHKARIHASKRDYICDICSKTFNTKTRLESHIVKHNASIAKKLAYCQLCDIQYKNIYVYRNHLKCSANHSERAYPCPECNKKFASKVYWTKHYNFYHLQKSQYNCEICNKLFISDWRLKNHKQKHHGLSRTRDHSCNICSKKFFTLATLRSHQQTHSDQRSYMCEDCGDTFKQRAALYTHTRLVHRGGGKRK